VDLEAFERLALPALEVVAAVAVVDELGKMELASDGFRSAVERLLAAERPVVATVHAYRHAFTDRLKARRDIELTNVTEGNRDALPHQLARRLALG
jgi:nucleoside-triphosphatase THEP1